MMAQATREISSYAEMFRAAGAGRRDPSWVERLREDAFERFEERGFPTTDEEDWKYTNVAPIARAKFVRPSAESANGIDASAIAPFVYAEARQSSLVFVNGFLRPDLSSLEALPAGVVALDLREALEGDRADVVREHLARGAGGDREDSFAALNTAFLDGGAFVHLPRGVKVETPIHLLFLSNGAQASVSFPRVLVVAESESETTVIESYASTKGAATYLTNAVVEVFVKDNARLVHYKVQDEGDVAFHVASTRAALGRASSYDLTTITLGASLSRHAITISLTEEGAECWVDGLYFVGTGQHADTHSLIDHLKPNCTSRQNYKGILDGKSRAVFNGRVFVHKDARLTDAIQSNKNLLLSNESRVDTKPQLEIFNDDVKCAHGTTVGQLEEEELFYLTSRGLHTDLARNLLTYGFAEEIVEKIKIPSIKAQLDEAILNRLHARLEA